ncbi:hypothetical protein [Nocardia brasiliensis]|uniref:hypothetical protein n=1 Tax=Nocardia brasiliensis TaxID=37326 RepID=UPI002455F57F|nr:hypothetical protein [Nocardia brasiliensis]
MKPYRVPADPAKLLKDKLAAVVPGLVAAPAPTFGLVVPPSWTTHAPPHVGVFDDGGPNRWPVSTAPTVRVTVWAAGRDRARRIAGVCLGVLLSHRVEGVATITDPTGLVEALDPHNNGQMCSFTVTAQARTLAG